MNKNITNQSINSIFNNITQNISKNKLVELTKFVLLIKCFAENNGYLYHEQRKIFDCYTDEQISKAKEIFEIFIKLKE